MSWRTRGIYRGLDGAAQGFLERFNKAWDTKAEGRERTDAMEWRVSDCIPVIPSSEIQFNGERDADFIIVMTAIRSFSTPKKAPRNSWRIRITLKSGERFKIEFNTLEGALHLHTELVEFRQWFRAT